LCILHDALIANCRLHSRARSRRGLFRDHVERSRIIETTAADQIGLLDTALPPPAIAAFHRAETASPFPSRRIHRQHGTATGLDDRVQLLATHCMAGILKAQKNPQRRDTDQVDVAILARIGQHGAAVR
jgi:hypothetical protein